MSFYLQLVTEKEVNNPSSMDVQRQLDSSGYLSVAPAGNEVSDDENFNDAPALVILLSKYLGVSKP